MQLDTIPKQSKPERMKHWIGRKPEFRYLRNVADMGTRPGDTTFEEDKAESKEDEDSKGPVENWSEHDTWFVDGKGGSWRGLPGVAAPQALALVAEFHCERDGDSVMRFDIWLRNNMLDSSYSDDEDSSDDEKGGEIDDEIKDTPPKYNIHENAYDVATLVCADGTTFRVAEFFDLGRFGRRKPTPLLSSEPQAVDRATSQSIAQAAQTAQAAQ